MKLIEVECSRTDGVSMPLSYTHRINPSAILQIVMKRTGKSVDNVCIVLQGEDNYVNVTPEAWEARRLVDDPDLDVASPDMASRPDGAIDARNAIPSASCCRIAISTIISACEAGVFDAGDAQVSEPVKTLIESHNKCLALIKDRAEEAYKHAGGRCNVAEQDLP